MSKTALFRMTASFDAWTAEYVSKKLCIEVVAHLNPTLLEILMRMLYVFCHTWSNK